MSLRIEHLDDSEIEKSIILSILSCEDDATIDKEISERFNKEDYLLAKKLALIMIGKKSHILGNRAISIVSDREFLSSILNGEINFERLKILLKLEMDPRVPLEDKNDIFLKYDHLPYSDLKQLYLKTKIEKELLQQELDMEKSKDELKFSYSRENSLSSPINPYGSPLLKYDHVDSEIIDSSQKLKEESRKDGNRDSNGLFVIPILDDEKLNLIDTVIESNLNFDEKRRYKELLEFDKILVEKVKKLNRGINYEHFPGPDEFIHKDKFLQVYSQSEEDNKMTHKEIVEKTIEFNNKITSSLMIQISNFSLLVSDIIEEKLELKEKLKYDNSLDDYETYLFIKNSEIDEYEKKLLFNELYRRLLSYENEKDFWDGDFQLIVKEVYKNDPL